MKRLTFAQMVRSICSVHAKLSAQAINISLAIFQTARRKVETLSPQFTISGNDLAERLSFSHLAELVEFDDPLKRAFYEHECIRGNWSVRDPYIFEFLGLKVEGCDGWTIRSFHGNRRPALRSFNVKMVRPCSPCFESC